MWNIINCVGDELTDMREWLRGIASPCQGEGRGFDSRLALETRRKVVSGRMPLFFLLRAPPVLEGFGLRFTPVGALV